MGTTTISGSSFVGVAKRELAPNHEIIPQHPGSPSDYDGAASFDDRDNASVSVSSPNLGTDLKSRYRAGLLEKQFRDSGNAVVLASLPQEIVVYSGSKGSSTSMIGTFFGGSESHFPGETLITDIIDTKAAAMTNLVTGSFFAEDISNTPFTDQTDKEVLFEVFTDTEIKNTLASSVSGSVFSNELLPGERFAAGGFTYEPTSFGPDTHGTDSVAYGGLLK